MRSGAVRRHSERAGETAEEAFLAAQHGSTSVTTLRRCALCRREGGPNRVLDAWIRTGYTKAKAVRGATGRWSGPWR
jgi:hypothetical protein